MQSQQQEIIGKLFYHLLTLAKLVRHTILPLRVTQLGQHLRSAIFHGLLPRRRVQEVRRERV